MQSCQSRQMYNLRCSDKLHDLYSTANNFLISKLSECLRILSEITWKNLKDRLHVFVCLFHCLVFCLILININEKKEDQYLRTWKTKNLMFIFFKKHFWDPDGKTLGLSKLVYAASILCVPEMVIKRAQEKLSNNIIFVEKQKL